MGFIIKTTVKIIIFFLLLIIPTALLISFFSLSQRNIPLWNIGFRNLFQHARNYYRPIIIISYLAGSLFTLSLTDKTRGKSLILLHIPPLIVLGILSGLFYLGETNRLLISIETGNIDIGYRTFIKENVFNDVKNRFIFLEIKGGKNILYIYDREKNEVLTLDNLTIGREGRNSLYIDEVNRRVTVRSGKDNSMKIIDIPYSDFQREKNITKNKILLLYGKQLSTVIKNIRDKFSVLPRMDTYLYFTSIILSILMVSIPLIYIINDVGWGFSGFTGFIMVLAIMPFVYGAALSGLQKININLSYLGSYSYLFPSIVIGLSGILIDVFAKVLRL